MRALALLLLGASALAAEGRISSGNVPAARAVILVDGDPAPAPRLAHVDEVWLSFVPKVQVVPPGSTLVFTAKDADSHTVHAWYGKQTLFNRASVAHGPEQRVVLDHPGIVALTCDLHAEMRAWVIVSDSAYSAVSDLDGRFSLTAPPGRHRVRAWQPGDSELRDLGEMNLDGELHLQLPARLPEVAATPAHAAEPPRRPNRLPEWLTRLGSRPAWPSGRAAWVLSILGAPIGFALAWALFWLGTRRGWALSTEIIFGCGLAFAFGALSAAGLSAAVATALGFGVFTGTILVGAQRLR